MLIPYGLVHWQLLHEIKLLFYSIYIINMSNLLHFYTAYVLIIRQSFY